MIFFYVLISVMPLTQHPLWSRFVGELTVIKYLGGVCLLYAILYWGIRRTRPPFFHTTQARAFVLLVLLASASFFSADVVVAWELSPLMSYVSFLLLFFLTIVLIDTLQRLRWTLLVAMGSVAFGSLYVLREWQKYHAVYKDFRPGWVVGDPNYFTVSALLCLPLAFYWVVGRRPRWERFFCLGCLIVTLVAVILAASRGGLLGLVAAFMFISWRHPKRVRVLTLAGVILLPLLLVAPASPVARLLHPTYSDEESAEARKAIWKAGLRMVREHPLTGVGLGNFKPTVEQYAKAGGTPKKIAHNAYLEIAAEMGLPSLLVFLVVLFGSFLTLKRVHQHALRSGNPLLQQVAGGMQAGLVAYAVAVFFVSAQYQKLFWLMVFLSMCLPLLERHTAPKEADLHRQPSFRPDAKPLLTR